MKGCKLRVTHVRGVSQGNIQGSDEKQEKEIQTPIIDDAKTWFNSNGFKHLGLNENMLQSGLSFRSNNNEISGSQVDKYNLLQKTHGSNHHYDKRNATRDSTLSIGGRANSPQAFRATSPIMFRVGSSKALATTSGHSSNDTRIAQSSQGFHSKNVMTKQFLFQPSVPKSALQSRQTSQDTNDQTEEPRKPYPNDLVAFVKKMYNPKIMRKYPNYSDTFSKNAYQEAFVTKIGINGDFGSQKFSTILKKQKQINEQQFLEGGLKTPIAKTSRSQIGGKSSDTTKIDDGESSKRRGSYNLNAPSQLSIQQGSQTGRDMKKDEMNYLTSKKYLQTQVMESKQVSPQKTLTLEQESPLKYRVNTLSEKLLHQRFQNTSARSSYNSNKQWEDENKIIGERNFLTSRASGSKPRRQAYSPQQFHVLFIFINNLSIIKRKSNLQFTILKPPLIQNGISREKVQEDFETLVQDIQHSVGINCRKLYFFRQNGFPIENHLILTQMNVNQEAIFFGSQAQFCGLADIKTEYPGCLNSVIDALLKKIEYLNSPMELQQFEILTKEQILFNHNKKLAQKIAQALTFNPEMELKHFDITSKKEQKLNQIEQILSKDLSSTKKIFVELPDNHENEPDKFSKEYNLREIAKYVDSFLEKIEETEAWKRCQQRQLDPNPTKKQKKDQFNGIESFWNKLPQQKGAVDFIQDNFENCLNKKSVMKILEKKNKELFIHNIPKLLNKYELSRHDLHSIYILYKALLNVSVQKSDWKAVLAKGVAFKAFESGIESLSSQGEETIKRMCNYNMFINWDSFLAILSSIQGKSLESKINIFLRVSDKDKSGSLSKAEVEELCDICLSKFIPRSIDESDTIIEELTEYFTKLLFSCLSVDINSEEIPLQKLRDAIINQLTLASNRVILRVICSAFSVEQTEKGKEEEDCNHNFNLNITKW